MRLARRPWSVFAILAVAALWSACQVYPDDVQSSFDLEGAHTDLTCSQCHGDTFDDEPPDCCGGCHAADTPPVHWRDEDCGECHGQERWDDLEFDHGEWLLTGAHIDTPCEDCHLDGTPEAGEDCEDCHLDDAPMFHPTEDCGHCHGTTSWHI